MKSTTLIRTAKHSTKFSNKGKLEVLSAFLDEYNRAVQFYVDYFWTAKTEWITKDGSVRSLHISNNQFDLPSFISTVGNEPTNTPNLSAKMFKSASSQALGIVVSIVAKRNKVAFKLNVATAKGDLKRSIKLQEQLNQFILTKPVANIKVANLDSNTVEFIKINKKTDTNFKEFDGFLKITSMSKTLGFIEIPVKFHRQIKNLQKRGYNQKTSWFVSRNEVSSLWERDKVEKKVSGRKVGADQGIKTCLTLSDGQVTSNCKHGHSIESIMHRISKCKKGSKGFKRAQDHRENYINWSIKQLNLADVNEIGYENVVNIRYKKNSSRLMSAWTFTTIRTAVERRCEEEGVLLSEQGSIYRSQRCSSCGFVHKKNRSKKEFKCLECGHHLDADLNGALNHEADLNSIPYALMSMKLNTIGFYWLESGLYDLHGEEITVPQQQNYKP
jgi:transposase